MTTIVGTSDLICFRDEADYFGVEDMYGVTTNNIKENHQEEEVDYSYTMLDPSGRYIFDVNPSRILSNEYFVAHFVNDASSINFNSSSLGTTVEKEKIVAMIEKNAIAYLNDSMTNFNCVMTPFGLPPLMAYVTTKPVDVGEELLASYGINYWLGKIKDDHQLMSIQNILDDSINFQRTLNQYDNHIDLVLEEAINSVHLSELYNIQTKVIEEIIRNHIRKIHRRRRSPRRWRQRLFSWWNRCRRRKV